MATIDSTRAIRTEFDDVILRIRNLDVHFNLPNGNVARVVDDCALDIYRGEILGVAGESGSGKTTLVEAILQINRFSNRTIGGSMEFMPAKGQTINLATESPRRMRDLRLREIAYIPQGSMNSLNPMLRVEDQLLDGMAAHGVRGAAARTRIPELLERVGLSPNVARLYPHELSGGMKQRVIIAIGISMNPSLIIADEPTTALDVNVQRRIVETLAKLRHDLNVTIMIVSHDLAVHAELADRVAVMYAGQVVETDSVRGIMKQPAHPYSNELMNSIPSIGKSRTRMSGIHGATPSPQHWPSGCRFHSRCPYAMPECERVAPPLVALRAGHHNTPLGPRETTAGRRAACLLYDECRAVAQKEVR